VVTHPGSARAVRAAGRLTGAPLAMPAIGDRARAARMVNQPRPAVVEARVDGTPVRVNRQPVALLREEWRVVDRWWTEEPVSRRYFEVVLQSGENAVVFRDETRSCWFTQRGA
jgi:hypothetical protein